MNNQISNPLNIDITILTQRIFIIARKMNIKSGEFYSNLNKVLSQVDKYLDVSNCIKGNNFNREQVFDIIDTTIQLLNKKEEND